MIAVSQLIDLQNGVLPNVGMDKNKKLALLGQRFEHSKECKI